KWKDRERHAIVREALTRTVRQLHDVAHAEQTLLVRREHRNDDVGELDRADTAGIAQAGATVDQHHVEALAPARAKLLDEGAAVAPHEEVFPVECLQLLAVVLVGIASAAEQRDGMPAIDVERTREVLVIGGPSIARLHAHPQQTRPTGLDIEVAEVALE